MVFIIESQINYILSALQQMGAREIASVEPKKAVQDAWNLDMHRRMQPTVWSTGGCASWYLDEHGRNTTLWPRTTFAFHNLTRTFDIDQYETTPRAAAPASTPFPIHVRRLGPRAPIRRAAPASRHSSAEALVRSRRNSDSRVRS